MSLEQAQAHQRKHGFPDLKEFVDKGKKAQAAVDKITGKLKAEPPKMNNTEREFSMILEAERRMGKILRWRFQGISLLWGGSMHYKPDFFVLDNTLNWRCVEVKGAKIWDRDIVRFKGCRAEWPEFEFQFWQKKDNKWTQLL